MRAAHLETSLSHGERHIDQSSKPRWVTVAGSLQFANDAPRFVEHDMQGQRLHIERVQDVTCGGNLTIRERVGVRVSRDGLGAI